MQGIQLHISMAVCRASQQAIYKVVLTSHPELDLPEDPRYHGNVNNVVAWIGSCCMPSSSTALSASIT